IEVGANVEIGYYDQEQALLSKKNTVLEEVWSEFSHIDEKDIRSILGNFLFTQDEVLKTVQTLSGGEKARVSLAKLMLLKANFLVTQDEVLKTVQTLSGGEKARVSLAKLMLLKANFLILDEPTNHLDLDSKEVLEAALAKFPGTILFVSHDRYFINKIADKVV